jgi:hypothetical protein
VRCEEPGRGSHDESALLAFLRPAFELPDRCLEDLIPVKACVLGEQLVAEGRDDTVRVAALCDQPVDDATRLVDFPFCVPAAFEVRELRRAFVTRRKTRGGDVQKTIEVDAESALVDPSHERRRGGPQDALVHRVRSREGVVDLVPVTVIVLGVEAHDPQRRRERHSTR